MFISAVVCAGCHIVLTMLMNWFFPLFTKIEQSFKALISNSFILAFGNIKPTLFYLLSVILCVTLIAFLFPYSVPFIALFPFFIVALASCCGTAEKINKAFGIETDDENADNDNKQ